VDVSSTLYVADMSYIVHSYTVAGAWSNVTALGQLTAPHDLAVDLDGDLYIADGTHVREVVSGQVQTVAATVICKPSAMAARPRTPCCCSLRPSP
jgi:hypothetical protein